jgi:hypothetical protein
MQYEFDNYTNHDVLKKHDKINSELSDDRVLAVCFDPEYKKFYLIEGCDDYFRHELTKEDCLDLANLFTDLANVIE